MRRLKKFCEVCGVRRFFNENKQGKIVCSGCGTREDYQFKVKKNIAWLEKFLFEFGLKVRERKI